MAIAGPRGVGAQIKRDLAAGPVSTKRAQEIQKELITLKAAEAANQERIRIVENNQRQRTEKLNAALTKSEVTWFKLNISSYQ